MNIRKQMKSGRKGESPSAVALDQPAEDADLHAPRKMTLAENVVLTIQVLTGFGLLGVALWSVKLWITP